MLGKYKGLFEKMRSEVFGEEAEEIWLLLRSESGKL